MRCRARAGAPKAITLTKRRRSNRGIAITVSWSKRKESSSKEASHAEKSIPERAVRGGDGPGGRGADGGQGTQRRSGGPRLRQDGRLRARRGQDLLRRRSQVGGQSHDCRHRQSAAEQERHGG